MTVERRLPQETSVTAQHIVPVSKYSDSALSDLSGGAAQRQALQAAQLAGSARKEAGVLGV